MKSTTMPQLPQLLIPSALERLVMAAPDKQIVLAAKLTFQNFINPWELRMLDPHFVLWRDREPVELILRRRGGMDGRRSMPPGRYVPIDPQHRAALAVLLPDGWPMFTDEDPWRRLRRFATSAGIVLERGCARNSCVTHAMAAGMSGGEAAWRIGRKEPFPKRLWLPVTRQDADAYFSVGCDSRQFMHLPSHSGRCRAALNYN